MIRQALQQLRNGEELSPESVTGAVSAILDGNATPAQIGAFLMGLSRNGERASEIAAAASVVRARALAIDVPAGAIDCCGTGGDLSNSLNISTAVSFVVAGCGVPVAKHGNRAASSQSGAADVLQALGVNLDITPDQCALAIRATGFCFLMAPNYHVALKPLAALRKELGFRTVFNLLGPLVNPARVDRQLIGVFSKDAVRPVAEAISLLGTTKSCVVHGSDGLDEVTLSGPTYFAMVEGGRITDGEFGPDDFGLEPVTLDEIAGGDAAYNAAALRGLLSGAESSYRRVVLANAAVALLVAGKCNDPRAGVLMAQESIDTGRAKGIFEQYRDMAQQWNTQ